MVGHEKDLLLAEISLYDLAVAGSRRLRFDPSSRTSRERGGIFP